MNLLVDILGWSGTILIIAAYYLVSNGKLPASGKLYQVLNLVGAVLLGVNVFYKQAWPAVALEAVWVLIAAVALIRIMKRAYK